MKIKVKQKDEHSMFSNMMFFIKVDSEEGAE